MIRRKLSTKEVLQSYPNQIDHWRTPSGKPCWQWSRPTPEAALRNLSYSTNWLDSAQAAVASSQRRYDKGAVDILELLNTQTALAETRQERLHTLAEWPAARLRLLTS